jgi:hypothetical protein
METELLAEVSHVTVNHSFLGFSVKAENPVGAGCDCGACPSGGGTSPAAG